MRGAGYPQEVIIETIYIYMNIFNLHMTLFSLQHFEDEAKDSENIPHVNPVVNNEV